MKKYNKLVELFKKSGPYLAAGVLDDNTSQNISHIFSNGLDIAELRVDMFSKQQPVHVLNEIDKFSNFPTVATVRTQKEGGEWNDDESKRLELFKAVIPKVDAIDIESSSKVIIEEVISKAKEENTLAIVSYHNFEKTPKLEFLQEIVDGSKNKGASIVKIATQVNSIEDINILSLLLAKNDKLIVIGMGSKGLITRTSFPSQGSLMTFCRLGKSTAPGQLSLRDMWMNLRINYPEYNERQIIDNELMECV